VEENKEGEYKKSLLTFIHDYPFIILIIGACIGALLVIAFLPSTLHTNITCPVTYHATLNITN
jgi:hypothetical protein